MPPWRESDRIVIEPQEENTAVYLTPLYVAEVNVARRLETLINAPKQMFPIDIEKALQWVEQSQKRELAEKQKEAIRKAVTSKVLVITGGPGTGKTTLLNCLIQILEQKNQRILLASPTGRAAKRLAEVTFRKAKTIHRLLEYSPKEGGFKRNEDNPLEADLVIIDEVSMVDILLMNHLLKAIPQIATLVLVGDVDQLPSVGPGNVLRDIIDSGQSGNRDADRGLPAGPGKPDRPQCPPHQPWRVPGRQLRPRTNSPIFILSKETILPKRWNWLNTSMLRDYPGPFAWIHGEIFR